MKNCKDVKIDSHVYKSSFDRSTDFNYLGECTTKKIPLGIVKTMENRFKLIYNHNKKTKQDLYIIIEINDIKEIVIVSSYPFKEDRRLREHERI